MTGAGGTTRRFGRAALAVGLLLGVGSVDLTGAAPVAGPPGLGKAASQLLRIDPTSAGLSFGVIFGPTSADHRNTVARAVAQSTNFGLIGGALTGEGWDGSAPPIRREQLPQPQRADSREAASHAAATRTEGPVTQSVVATPKPHARATSRLADVTLPGLVTLAGVTNESTSGVDEAGNRVASARARVGQLSFAGGAVTLGDLEWVATHRAGAEPVGSFTMGSAKIAGVPVPAQDAGALFDALNATLGTLGIEIGQPRARIVEDTVYVDPLSISVVPNASRDLLAGALLSALQPVREQLFGALIEADCGNAAYVTIIDLMLGSVTGGGSMRLSVAGVSAGTGVADEFAFAPLPPPPAGTPPAAVVTNAPPAPAGTVVAPVTTAPAAPTGTPLRPASQALDPVSDGAVAVALGSLALGAALIEGDRRKMRRAERVSEAVA